MKASFSSRKILLSAAGLVFLLAVFLALGFAHHLTSPADREGGPGVFVVEDGWTLKDVAAELERRRMITSRTLFRLWARIQDAGRSIRAGEYRLGPHMTPLQILDMLTRGSVISHPVTIPEGYTAEQIAAVLEREGLAVREEFMALFRDRGFMAAHGLPGPTLEGYLYPDTYQFARGVSSRRIAETMIRRFWEVMEPLRPRIAETGLGLGEVVILASIVEKETGRPEERALIASVFLNRLNRGMRLDSDPTVIYGIDGFDGNLTRSHLRTPTPYNTYRMRGLPPGPIANPGEAAIRAVLEPAESNYLYFVSRNDGSHHFSRTLSEHNRAVRTYQKGGGRGQGETS
ncbi:MAG: endolytic transglycosylase MltG [Deltaproteobacteria bacterium]|nr:endolytic transglycosylase MltG [Deltaproteobacteria bacterium]